MVHLGRRDESWNCPHCGQRIPRSAATCPACQRHLRVGAVSAAKPARATVCPLNVDSTIQHPGTEAPWEYTVMIEVQGAAGEIMARHVAALGVLQPGQGRRFTLRVEVLVPGRSR